MYNTFLQDFLYHPSSLENESCIVTINASSVKGKHFIIEGQVNSILRRHVVLKVKFVIMAALLQPLGDL